MCAKVLELLILYIFVSAHSVLRCHIVLCRAFVKLNIWRSCGGRLIPTFLQDALYIDNLLVLFIFLRFMHPIDGVFSTNLHVDG